MLEGCGNPNAIARQAVDMLVGKYEGGHEKTGPNGPVSRCLARSNLRELGFEVF